MEIIENRSEPYRENSVVVEKIRGRREYPSLNKINYLVYFANMDLTHTLENLKLMTIRGIDFYVYDHIDYDSITVVYCECCKKIVIEGSTINYDKYEIIGCSGVCGTTPLGEYVGGCGKSLCSTCGGIQICVDCTTFYCLNCEPNSDPALNTTKDFQCSKCS